MKNNTIVSLADSNYFDLLNELVDSILKFSESKEVDICILDAGLSDEQKNTLSTKVKEIKKAEWDIEVPGYKVGEKEWLKSQVSRGFLPKYFPGYNKYLWIDCDAWVNDWSSVELYFKACEGGKLGITQTMGPGYRIMSKVKWLFGKFAIIKSQNFKHAISSNIGLEKARKLAFAPHINIGVFSLEENSPCWKSWQENLKTTLSSGKVFGSEGLAINMSVYVDEETDVITEVDKFSELIAHEYDSACESGDVVAPIDLLYMTSHELKKQLIKKKIIEINSLNVEPSQNDINIKFDINKNPLFLGKFEFLVEKVKESESDGYKVVVVAPTKGQVKRVQELSNQYDLDMDIDVGYLSNGFSCPDLRMMFVAEHEILGLLEIGRAHV